MRTCDIDGCDRKHEARGLCKAHYRRLVESGDPLPNVPVRGARPTCTVDGCERPHHSNGYCDTHKARMWRHGDVESRRPMSKPKPPIDMRSPLRRAIEDGSNTDIIQALLAHTLISGHCALWQRSLHKGYPKLQIGGRMFLPHRLMAAAVAGREIASREPVHHRCANRLCINPMHLEITTSAANTAEMLERNGYRARIAQLEEALRLVDPTNRALSHGMHTWG